MVPAHQVRSYLSMSSLFEHSAYHHTPWRIGTGVRDLVISCVIRSFQEYGSTLLQVPHQLTSSWYVRLLIKLVITATVQQAYLMEAGRVWK